MLKLILFASKNGLFLGDLRYYYLKFDEKYLHLHHSTRSSPVMGSDFLVHTLLWLSSLSQGSVILHGGLTVRFQGLNLSEAHHLDIFRRCWSSELLVFTFLIQHADPNFLLLFSVGHTHQSKEEAWRTQQHLDRHEESSSTQKLIWHPFCEFLYLKDSNKIV